MHVFKFNNKVFSLICLKALLLLNYGNKISQMLMICRLITRGICGYDKFKIARI